MIAVLDPKFDMAETVEMESDPFSELLLSDDEEKIDTKV